MAKIETLIPFFLCREAGGAPSCMVYKTVNGRRRLAGYDPSVASLERQYVESSKKGLSNDKDDRGGLTMCGVTWKTYVTYCGRIGRKATEDGLKALSYSDWLTILKTLYWDKWNADDIESQGVANLLVDWYWASGSGGVKITQRLLGVTADGIAGKKTIAALNAADASTLFAQIKQARIEFIEDFIRRNPEQKKWRNGWLKRLNAIFEDGGFTYFDL